MAALSRERAVLRLAVGEGQIAVRGTAEQLHLSTPVASTTLRALERAGHLDGQLVGGGRLGYRPTAQGREWLNTIERRDIAAPS